MTGKSGRALCGNIHSSVGHIKADTLVLEAQFDFAPDTTMPAAANATVAAAERLYGKGVAGKVKAAFEARGVL